MNEAKELLPDSIIYTKNSYDACSGADAVIIMTEWNQYRALDLDRLGSVMKSRNFIDLRNVYQPRLVKEKGFTYIGVGRS